MPSRAGIARAVLCAACLAGCRFAVPTDARLDPDPPGSAVRPEDLAASPRGGGRTAAKTLPVELVFVRLDTQDSEMRDALWKLVDEQALDDALRRRLAANGLRAGIVTSQLPGRQRRPMAAPTPRRPSRCRPRPRSCAGP